MKPVDVTDEAKADLLDIVDWLSDNSPRAAMMFIDNFTAAVERLREFPGIGVPSRQSPATGRRVLHVERYAFVYEELDDRIALRRILDGRRLWQLP